MSPAMGAIRWQADDAVVAVDTVAEVRESLKGGQREDGHWIFKLEPDATIPSEYVLLQHYLGEIDTDEERKIAVHLRESQTADGGWALFAGGAIDLSATVKAYYALKLIGDPIDAPHMVRARSAILARGGAAQSNVFTRIALALFGQVPWRAVPVMPAEIMLLPEWFPFHLMKVSYWSRTVIVPLLILMALKPTARNPRGVGIRELFTIDPDKERRYVTNASGELLGHSFVVVDHVLRRVERFFPAKRRAQAIKAAVAFIKRRLNGIDGFGGIFPAMANTVMAFDALGYPADDPDLVTAKKAIRRLMVVDEDRAYCQPCLSPVWDTALTIHALLEAGEPPDGETLRGACRWLLDREIVDYRGDWVAKRPKATPGGWAFQYRNDAYPDVDDTAVVAMALHRIDPVQYAKPIERAARWILDMQSKNGGWGAFDADNTHHYLNHIPFADHGALLDPPTVDVTARCLGMLAQLGYGREHPAVKRGLDYLIREQEKDGSWYGRWGVNYVYGTWSALMALRALGEDPNAPHIRKAVDWLKSRQHADGGWGEGCTTYWDGHHHLEAASTPSQTAWALLGLMAAGEAGSGAAARAAAYLEFHPRDGSDWEEEPWTGVGFPRVFYLKYHGYAAYFPLWALARYHRLASGEIPDQEYGM